MKKIIIFIPYFIVVLICVLTVKITTSYAINILESNVVFYTNSSSSVTTVQDAIDELYQRSIKSIAPVGWDVPPSTNYTQEGLSVYSNRCSIVSGGYIVKDGVCYVDIYVKLNIYASNNVLINGFPLAINDSIKVMYNSANYDSATDSALAAFNPGENGSLSFSRGMTDASTNGATVRIWGSYKTNHADT